MKNLKVKDLISFSGIKFHCVQTSWTIGEVITYLIENNIPSCPVTHSKLKDGVVGRIRGYAILNNLILKLKNYSETKIEKVMEPSKWELSDDQYLVDHISVLYRKPVFAIKNSRNQYYATTFQKDVAEYLHHISSRFMFLRAIENKLTSFIYSLNQDESVYKLQLRRKIDLLFSDDIWSIAKIEFDKSRLKKILIECCQIRNKYFHYHERNVDLKNLKRSWNIIKRNLFYIPIKEVESDDLLLENFSEYLNENPQILRDLPDKSRMTKKETKVQAKVIWNNYCDQNKEGHKKIDYNEEKVLEEIARQRRWDEALTWESYNTLFEHADNYGLDD